MKPILMAVGGLLVLPVLAAAENAPSILQPKNNGTVDTPVTIVIAPEGLDRNNANMSKISSGTHLHLIVDAPLLQPGKMVPMDAHHIHLLKGETRETISLAPGRHTIQLIEGGKSHTVGEGAPHSDPVTFDVSGNTH
jgi:hypothetical protein